MKEQAGQRERDEGEMGNLGPKVRIGADTVMRKRDVMQQYWYETT